MNGFLCIDKPVGPTSFDIVRKIRGILHTPKVGHAGTLDPLASGLLVIALGNTTRLLQFLPTEPKTYRFGIQFGTQTDTLDAEGGVVKTGAIPSDAGDIEAAVNAMVGKGMQTPPRFSAVKVDGKRAYDLARKGHDINLKPRPIHIFSFALLHYDKEKGTGDFEVCCSGGTYVRSLARDIGEKIGTCGSTTYIRRMAIGQFSLHDAFPFHDIASAENYIIPTRDAFRHIPSYILSDERVQSLMHGRDIAISSETQLSEGDIALAIDSAGVAVALIKNIDNRRFHPMKVVYNSAT